MTLPDTVIAQLGSKPDHQLADEAGVGKWVILKERHKLGVPSYASATGVDGHFIPGHRPTRWSNHPKQTKAERAVVQRYGTLKRRYGVTQAEYDQMLVNQGGVCAICHTAPDPVPLCVDHDSSTQRVRGLLCKRCNQGIGLLWHDPARLSAAIDYLT